MRIVERHFANKSGNDQTYFLRCFSRARKFHKYGKSLDTEAELAECISKEFWAFTRQLRTVPGAGAFGTLFYKDACKVRCMINDHGATVGGYIVLHGELKALWCDVPGYGCLLIQQALNDGAERLQCLDGHLVDLYSQFAFRQVARQPNWVPGEPDVVTMERVAECRSPHCECDDRQRAHCPAKLEDQQRSRHV